MKQFLILLLYIIVSACDKDSVNADLSAEIQGTYQVYLVSDDTKDLVLPMPNLSMAVTLTPIDKSSCKYVLAVNSVSDISTDERVFYLRKANAKINIYEDSNLIGFVNGNELELTFEDVGRKSVMKARS